MVPCKWTAACVATPVVTGNQTLLGQVLVAGGDYYDGINAGFLTECELYDPTLGTWSVTASMSTPRFGARAALLRDGRVLEAGGETDFNYIPTASAELYSP